MIGSALVAVLACLLGGTVAGGQDGAPEPTRLARDVFLNVPALGDVPVDEFMDTMGMFSAALSLNCTDCHTQESGSSWEAYADETPLKQTARAMMAMVNAINSNNFGGVPLVTCYTCHRGGPRPEAAPSLTVQYSLPPEDPNRMEVFPSVGAPPADEIFDAYIRALGGAERLGRLTSFVARGSYSGFDTEQLEVPVEIFAQAPDRRATIVHAFFGDSVRIYDGRNGWIASADRPLPLMPLTGGNLEGARIEAMVAFPAQLRRAFSQWRVGSTFIDDSEVYVVQGSNAGQLPVNLYFDESGLLIRLVRWSDTAVGAVPTQIDFADYREVLGIQMPFRFTVTWTNGQSTTQLTEVQPNVSIDPARFGRPAPASSDLD